MTVSLILLLSACSEPTDDTAPRLGGALGEGPLNPFPSVELVADGHLALDADTLPHGETAWDAVRLDRRTGFSRVQTSVVRLPDPVDPESIGGEGGLGVGGTVRMVDLDTGAEIPVLAELDANETGDNPVLLVRPMQAMTPGHQVAVLLTSGVTSGGAPIDVPAPEGHYAELADTLAGLGQDDVRLAWDFPVGDGTGSLKDVLASVTTPAAWSWERTWTAEEAPVPALLQAEGTYTGQSWLVDDMKFELDADGHPVQQGTAEAYLFVHVPASVLDHAPGTAPVFVFGHGIFGTPKDYLADPDTVDSLAIFDALGAVVVATDWRGLYKDDRGHAIDVAGDFARISEVTDMLHQGVANVVQLQKLAIDGALFDDPLFDAVRDRIDREHVYYYGISLGGIEGAVTLSQTPAFERGVLHVGGSDWSTMLERSVQWPVFSMIVSNDFEDAGTRQLLYAASQLYWDAVDPSSYVEDLAGRSLLWQESIGDDQVANITTELLMRSVGVPLATPAVTSPFGITTVAMPTAAPAFTQFDPLTARPPETNVPGEVTYAHGIPRTWAGTQAQTADFFVTGGQVTHHCGDDPCTAENTGSW